MAPAAARDDDDDDDEEDSGRDVKGEMLMGREAGWEDVDAYAPVPLNLSVLSLDTTAASACKLAFRCAASSHFSRR